MLRKYIILVSEQATPLDYYRGDKGFKLYFAMSSDTNC